jgi:hypothetical protein
MSKHSKGPWSVGSPGIGIDIRSADGHHIAHQIGGTPEEGWPSGRSEEAHANARLMAAAPTLLGRVRDRLDACACPDNNCDNCCMDRAAIALAETQEGKDG